MAFIGFWMIPLVIIFLLVDKFLEYFGFDLSAWLLVPGNIEKLLQKIDEITEFTEKMFAIIIEILGLFIPIFKL